MGPLWWSSWDLVFVFDVTPVAMYTSYESIFYLLKHFSSGPASMLYE